MNREENCHDHAAAVSAAERVLPEETELSALSELFKVFGDSTRIRILYALAGGEMCVCGMAELLGLTQPAISYQLKILRQAKLVRCRRAGKTAFYALADDHVGTIIGVAKEHLEER